METLREYFLSHLCVRRVIILCVANQVLTLLLSPRFFSQSYSLPTPAPPEHGHSMDSARPGYGPGNNTFFQTAQRIGDDKKQRINTTNGWYSNEEDDPNQNRCALCFFGLPRSFETMVLPSIVKNLLIPNAHHNCDIFMHFYEIYEEGAGRKNQGGKLDPRQVYLLEQAVQTVQAQHHGHQNGHASSDTHHPFHRAPTVSFINDTEAGFWKKRGAIIAKYQNTTHRTTGRPVYFPYNAITYHKSSVDNMVRQWHSIESVFRLMETTAQQLKIKYSRVGMFRSDVMYMTPLDIALLDQGVVDRQNRHVVVPGFGSWPVNDRMIYGNFDGVKIWSTRRFSLIEVRALSRRNAGWVMHSERFLDSTVFPAIKGSGYKVNTNWDICFLRTRADMTALISDCAISGTSRGWDKVDGRALVESIIEKNCSTPFNPDSRTNRKWAYVYVGCRDGIAYPKDMRYIKSNPGRV